jgi:hypothetical protein
VKIRLYPGKADTGYIFENGVVGSSIPKAFIKPIEASFKEALACGVLSGYPRWQDGVATLLPARGEWRRHE